MNEAVPRSPEKPQAKIPARPTAREVEGEKRQSAGLGHEILEIGGYDFKYICEIEPERNDDGTVRMLAPQDRYENTGYLTLNRYGAGPFCKFKIPWNISKCGVYALVVDEQIHYVGETENLSNRFNMGYGNISPRNCFAGGQETNCRINSLIFDKLSEGCRVTLWFHTTDEYKKVESALREIGAFGWNRV
ncbi:hypothetical protein DES49_0660 [Halospina denitrificans]|uniref:GIY-YIG domain-containing protein n=1 Tax=Halospina denitrificans TaxID=332522 RepID=A0A4R7K4H1_9GAMM|nr:GIY-YIG nuclease family protein [Halospina denitrificans]TDT44549.1 hypothetical protein DES49_0660 [Halospina denitrificans]